jgi:hypothetical protein
MELQIRRNIRAYGVDGGIGIPAKPYDILQLLVCCSQVIEDKSL